MRAQASWLVRGQAQTRAALDDHADAIRELQQQVAHLTGVIARVEPLAEAAAKLPDEMRAAVDDLSARIGALHDVADLAARIDELERVVQQLAVVITRAEQP